MLFETFRCDLGQWTKKKKNTLWLNQKIENQFLQDQKNPRFKYIWINFKVNYKFFSTLWPNTSLVIILRSSQVNLGEGNGSPLQYSCLENPMDGGAWWAAVHGVAKSRTRLGDFCFTFHFHALEKDMATQSSVLAWRIPGTGEPGGLPFIELHRVRHDWSDLAAAAASG